jgi:hypothetical protein
MNPTLLTLIAAAIAAYAFKDKLGLGTGDGVTSAVGKSDAPTGPDYAKSNSRAPGLRHTEIRRQSRIVIGPDVFAKLQGVAIVADIVDSQPL